MSNLVKIILFVAFAIFAIGFIWAIVVAVKRPNETAKNDPKPSAIETPAPTTPTPAPTPTSQVTPAPTPAPAPANPVTNNRRQTTHYYVTEYTYTADGGDSFASTGDGTWAWAGTDANGNAYAEAHAN